MNKRQWAEAFSGLVAMFLALAGLIYLLFGPIYSFASSTGAHGTTSLLQTHLQPSAIIALCIFLLAIVGVGVGAVCHNRTQKEVWQRVLLFSVIVMTVGTLLGILSIGPIIAPGTLFAILTLYLSRTRNQVRQA